MGDWMKNENSYVLRDVIHTNNDFIFNFERNADDEKWECQLFCSFQIKKSIIIICKNV